jgi:hypothetical protein
MKTRRFARWILITALAGGLLLSLPQAVSAAEPTVTLISAEAQDGELLLEVMVTDAAGKPIGGVPVSFGFRVDFFGERTVPIGSASTDVVGRASLAYRPSANGPQEIVARAKTADGTVVSEPLLRTISGASPAVPPEPELLPIVRRWAIPVAVTVVIAVWLVLVLLFASAVVGIFRADRRAEGAAPPEQPVAAIATPESLKEG